MKSVARQIAEWRRSRGESAALHEASLRYCTPAAAVGSGPPR